MSAVRLLPWHIADGAWNMAADEALLSSAAAGVASLRFYGWTEATLSLGYFQPHAPARAVPALAELAWVRRPSGGMALVHHHEVTYALTLPPGSAWQPAGQSWLIRMHEVIRDALNRLSVESRLCTESVVRSEVLCFLHHTPGDIVIGESKVVGSAQRKGRGGLMQHGSILLRRSPHTPALPGIAELSGRILTTQEFIDGIVATMQRCLGWTIAEGAWTYDEASLCTEWAHLRYSSETWNKKR